MPSWAEPPLVPSPDEARGSLRRELLDPEYHQVDPVQALLDWLDRVLRNGLEAAEGAPVVSVVVAMLLLLALVAALAWLVSRGRRTAGLRRRAGEVLLDERTSAEELRDRADRALAAGDHGLAVVEGFRALARRHVERGLLSDDPGATAREVAAVLAGEPGQDPARLHAAADLFDSVLYGGLPATYAQATEVLALDDTRAGLR